MEDKIKRFIELSEKFSKSSVDLFGEGELTIVGHSGLVCNGYMHTEGISYNIRPETSSGASINKEKTRSEKMQEELDTKKKLSDDFDEYVDLGKKLKEYYSAKEKLQ